MNNLSTEQRATFQQLKSEVLEICKYNFPDMELVSHADQIESLRCSLENLQGNFRRNNDGEFPDEYSVIEDWIDGILTPMLDYLQTSGDEDGEINFPQEYIESQQALYSKGIEQWNTISQ